MGSTYQELFGGFSVFQCTPSTQPNHNTAKVFDPLQQYRSCCTKSTRNNVSTDVHLISVFTDVQRSICKPVHAHARSTAVVCTAPCPVSAVKSLPTTSSTRTMPILWRAEIYADMGITESTGMNDTNDRPLNFSFLLLIPPPLPTLLR